MTKTLMRRPVGQNVAEALRELSAGRALDRFPVERQPLDAFPPRGDLQTLLGECSIWNFTLSVAESAFLGGSAAGLTLFKAVGLSAQANPTGITAPVFPNYNDQITYLLNNPAFMRGIRFSVSDDATQAAYLASLQVSLQEYSPIAGGYQMTNSVPLSVLRSPYQQQAGIIDFLANFPLTGYTFLQLVAPAIAPADVTITMTVLTDKPARLADQLPAPGSVLQAIPGAPQPPAGAFVGGKAYRGRG